ncbi:TPA: hypothetical protein PCK46_001705 [Klebsiella quasipneumoniae]|nr:hypothetical protein [Klebsiella quasipneumoniae]
MKLPPFVIGEPVVDQVGKLPSAPVGSATVIMVISSVSFIPVLMKFSRLVSRKLCPLVLKSGLPFFAGVGLLGIRLRVSESSLLKKLKYSTPAVTGGKYPVATAEKSTSF